MSRIFVLICILGALTVSFADVGDEESLTVRTSTATFHGKRYNVNPYQLPDYHASVAAYTRIPFAEPPVGDLRFRRPVPLVVEGDFDATRKSVMCPQVNDLLFDLEMEMSEDCLYIDVFVPEHLVMYCKNK